MSECTQLKIYLIKQGISQRKIAQDTGLHRNTVSKLVKTGEGAKPVRVLMRLYLHLDEDVFNDLLEQA